MWRKWTWPWQLQAGHCSIEKAGCDEVWSEDMGDGQTYSGVKCVNPFAADFAGLGE